MKCQEVRFHRSARLLIFKIHLDLMIFCLTGLGTKRHVFIPRSDKNSSSAALSHFALLGDFRSCFQVLGVSNVSDVFADFDQVPNLSG